MKQEKRKRRKKRTKKRFVISKVGLFFLIMLLVLLVLGITVSAGWLWMNHSGQNRLSKKQEAVPELMQQAAQEAETESETMLEAGSIRYHGKVYTYKKDILTFLFLGIDKNGEVKASSNLFEGGQSDALFLAVLDPGEKKISVIGINRDTMASMNVYDKNGRYSGRRLHRSHFPTLTGTVWKKAAKTAWMQFPTCSMVFRSTVTAR